MQIRSQRSATLFGFVLCAACAVTAAEEPVTVSSPLAGASAAASPINGTWKGVYFTYPNLMALELNLSSLSGGAVSGVLKYHPAVKLRSAFGTPKQGSYQVSGQYDDSSHSFLLKPGAWIEKPDMAGAVAPIAGVFDTKANLLAGVFEFQSAPSPMFFVLASENSGDQLIADISRSAYPAPLSREQTNRAFQDSRRVAAQRIIEQLKSMPHQAGSEEQFKLMQEKLQEQFAALPGSDAQPGGWAPPPADQLLEWAARLKKELPALDLGKTVMGKIYIPALNLFDDVYFKEHFGITYEEMDTAQRKAVGSVFSQHGRELSGYDFLSRPFQNVGDFGAPDVTVSIYWQRVLRSWISDLQASFAAMRAEVSSFTHLDVAESAAAAELPFLWPSEKDRFTSALAATRTRLAGPVLRLQADQLIATATGNAGARELAAWRVREKDILQYASPAEREKLQQRIDTRLDEVLEQLVAANVRSLATLGHGLDAVLAGNEWYQQVAKSYDFAMARPPIQAAIQQFQLARAKSLAEAKPAIIAQLDAAGQEAQVQYILDNILRCPGDAVSEVSAAIRQHASQRLAYLQRQQLMGLFSDYEKSLMIPPESGHLDLSKADKKHIPQPEELRLALLRGMAYGTGKVLDPHTAKVSTLFGGGSMIVRISDTTHGRYVYIKERDSWMVLYQVDMLFSLPDHDALWDADPNLRRGAQIAVDTVNTTAALLSQEDNIQEFRLYDDGWGVPDLRQEGAGRAGLETMLKGMMKQR